MLGVAVMDRDRELLEFMGQWRFMVLGQVQRFLGSSYRVAARRAQVLVKLGLVQVSVPLGDQRKAYWVSYDGLRFLGIEPERSSRGAGPMLSQFDHDRILVDIALDFRQRSPEFSIYGEAGMRRLDTMRLADGEEPEFALSRYKFGKFIRVYPDMVAVGPGGRFYIEYEHTKKDRQRMHSLVSTMLNSEKVSAAKYYASHRAYPQLQRICSESFPNMPLVGGKPKIQVELYDEQGSGEMS
ncbi:hypothetical protein [Rothia uropygialis]|uniref:hypothetical protein n=1 Tax=Kocuria sp. 36 TaxID=1415402 RepID=UPI00101CA9CE|nr:hypothetical protein [Kocuria sp. 36]